LKTSERPLTVWILQTGEPLHLDPGDRRPMRAMNVANALVEAGHRAVVWSAAFSHQEKRQRTQPSATIVISDKLEYRLVPSPGYTRNIGVGRLWDHARLATNLRRDLQKEQQLPDVCLVGFPPIEAAAVMTDWLRKNGVPSLLDVKDQWPELFVDAVPPRFRGSARVALSPYYSLARRAMRNATGISSMADSFLDWALTLAERPRSPSDHVAPLTSPRVDASQEEMDAASAWWSELGIRRDGKARFCFIGSHTRSFDFTPVLEAARRLAQQEAKCDFVICGTGELSQEWRRAAAGLPNVIFPGWVNSAQVSMLAQLCSGFIAPYIGSQDFERSVPNKIIDAMSHGLPIVTSLRGEVAALIDQCGIGMRYGTDSGRSLYDCVTTLATDGATRQKTSASAARLYDDRFSYDKVYGDLVAHLEGLAAGTVRA